MVFGASRYVAELACQDTKLGTKAWSTRPEQEQQYFHNQIHSTRGHSLVRQQLHRLLGRSVPQDNYQRMNSLSQRDYSASIQRRTPAATRLIVTSSHTGSALD